MPSFAILPALERILLTLWVGGLWVTGFVVAPLLFRSYERIQAGEIAGRIFAAQSLLGFVCVSILLMLALARAKKRIWRDWRVGALLLALVLILIGDFGLAARMRELKAAMAASPDALADSSEFAWLHGIASLLFLVNSILGLALVLFGTRPRVQAGN